MHQNRIFCSMKSSEANNFQSCPIKETAGRSNQCSEFKGYADFLRSGKNFLTQKIFFFFLYFSVILTLESMLYLPLKIPTVNLSGTVLKDHWFVPDHSFCLLVTIHL